MRAYKFARRGGGWGCSSPPNPGFSLTNTSGARRPRKLRYIESEGDPEKDPLLLWTNGGPGASSMWGVLSELGPLQLNEESLTTEDFNTTGGECSLNLLNDN